MSERRVPGHGKYAASSIRNGLLKLRDLVGLWQEQATTVTSGRVTTTGYEPGAEESIEAWALIDPMDAIAVGDPVALATLGDTPITLGKIVRGTVGMLRIRRHIALTGPAASVSTLPAAGTGASATIDGNDNAGTITLTPGTGPAVGSLFRITFAVPRENNKYNVYVTPRTTDTRSLGGVVGQINTALASVDIDCRTALTPSTTYTWGYRIEGFE